MTNSSGFYKLHEDILLYGPNSVESTGYSMYKESKDDYSYPVDGWYWFDEQQQAYDFFQYSPPNNN